MSDVAAMHRERITNLHELRRCIVSEQPYSILKRLKLAKVYQALGYPDLAAGDAYKALLLIDEVVEEGEYHDETAAAALADLGSNESAVSTHGDCYCESAQETQKSDEERVMSWATTCWSRTAYEILIPCLIACGCFRSTADYNARALKAFPGIEAFETHQKTLLNKLHSHFDAQGKKLERVDVQDYPDKGHVRRELYPWNEFEPDRFSADVLMLLNEEMERIAPRLEVKVAELPLLGNDPSSSTVETRYIKQLGVFAKEDILPDQEILNEKSLLTAVSRLHDSYCDACSIPLPSTREFAPQDHSAISITPCDECDEVFFCSQECYDLAQNYHPSLCGVTIEEKVPASEAADSLYTLLLVRAIALAETQGVHPLELKEIRYIWGDYHSQDLDVKWNPDADAFGSIPQTLPFSFKANVLQPLHILEKMDINIFAQSDKYDTWVFNTLYAKFRGTASAKQGLDGRPEIGAVHPMWCLANHSCDPNVAWEWRGNMRFWTRGQLIDWPGRHAGKKPGLRKGEEVFSHYCDIRLPVKERREWAVGALGGLCVCSRCIYEADPSNHGSAEAARKK